MRTGRIGSGVLARLPKYVWDVRHVPERFPGSPAVRQRPGVTLGANCQLFAYEVLRICGLNPPALRSRELWDDEESTVRIGLPRALDLVLVNEIRNPWGAHVGVYVGADQVLHLCAEVGFPAVWGLDELTARQRYRTLIGYKRVISRQP